MQRIPARLAAITPFFGIFQNYALRRRRTKLLGRCEKYIRRWFEPWHIQTGDDHLEVMSDAEPR